MLKTIESLIQGTKSIDLLTKAIRFQTQVTQLAITGRGIDNHLLAVERVAKESGLEVPGFLRDSNYDLFNNFKLSTSQVQTSSAQMIMCYGPVVPDGYGVCYNPQKVPKALYDKLVRLLSPKNRHQYQCRRNKIFRRKSFL